MKKSTLIFFAILAISISVHSQTMDGTYTNTWESNAGGALTYTLTLNPDKTFEFVSHRVYESTHPAKTTTVVGTWNNKNRLLILTTDPASKETELVDYLNENKAKFKSYSPRHRKYKTEKPNLKFYKSKVFYAKGMKLFKKEDDSTVKNS